MERGVRVVKVEQQALLQPKISVHHRAILFPLLPFLLIALLSFRPHFQHMSRLIAHHQLLTRKGRQLRYHRQVVALPNLPQQVHQQAQVKARLRHLRQARHLNLQKR